MITPGSSRSFSVSSTGNVIVGLSLDLYAFDNCCPPCFRRLEIYSAIWFTMVLNYPSFVPTPCLKVTFSKFDVGASQSSFLFFLRRWFLDVSTLIFTLSGMITTLLLVYFTKHTVVKIMKLFYFIMFWLLKIASLLI